MVKIIDGMISSSKYPIFPLRNDVHKYNKLKNI